MKIVVVSALIAALVAGCGGSGADNSALHKAHKRGYSAGVEASRSGADSRVASARRNAGTAGYHRGYQAGLSRGDWLATPENVVAGTNYIVSFERGSTVPWTLKYYGEMPLGTTWSCSDLSSCEQITSTSTSGSPSYDYTPPSYDSGSGYDYSSPGTTENYGSGNGYPVICADGTLSDSGGIQGACSHHGGVP